MSPLRQTVYMSGLPRSVSSLATSWVVVLISQPSSCLCKLGGQRVAGSLPHASGQATRTPRGNPALVITGRRNTSRLSLGTSWGISPTSGSQGLQCCPGEIGGWHQPSGTIKGTFQLAMLRLSLCSFFSISFPAHNPVESSKVVY